jgi:acyl-CoA reductase-like NAD-dependent aldehyde dehydrogenase
MADAAKSNLKKVSLELGGKSPLVIFKDADGLYFSALQSGNFCSDSFRYFVNT